jgi:hypothetical protein
VICSVKIYRRLGGSSGFVEGAFYIAGMFLPLLPRLGAGDNVMMFLVLCTGVAALVWLDERPLVLGFSLIVPAVFKGLTASWCPLLLVKPAKWRTLVWMAAWTILLNGWVFFQGGVQPFKVWLHDILPDALSMGVQQYWHQSMNLKGIAYKWGWADFPAPAMQGIQLAGLLAVYLGYWRQRENRGAAALANLCAALVAILVLFILGNAVSWLPYITFLLPFAGWAVIEYDLCSATEKTRIKILAGGLFLLLPAVHWLFAHFILKYPEAFIDAARDWYFGVEMIFLMLAGRRLFGTSPSPWETRR